MNYIVLVHEPTGYSVPVLSMRETDEGVEFFAYVPRGDESKWAWEPSGDFGQVVERREV